MHADPEEDIRQEFERRRIPARTQYKAAAFVIVTTLSGLYLTGVFGRPSIGTVQEWVSTIAQPFTKPIAEEADFYIDQYKQQPYQD